MGADPTGGARRGDPISSSAPTKAAASRGLLRRLGDALDERTGHRAILRHALDEPIPGGVRWSYVFGSALLVTLLVQVATGYLLMTTYAPSAQSAWASVHYITYRMSAGWFVRGLHHWGSAATIVVLAAHLAQTALFGAYKRPREMNWWFGLVLMGVVLGFSLTGYLLPWDQKGYWATRVATNIAGTLPLVGRALQKLAQGGDAYGHLTLTRFYALHVGVLPLLFFVFTAVHVALFRKHGVTPAAGADHSRVERFYPKQLAYDVVASLLVFAVVASLAWREHGAPLDAPADGSSDYPARPEWYFLSLFQLLKYFHGPLEIVGTAVLPGLAALFLFALPLLDRAPSARARDRLAWLGALGAGGAAVVALTLLSVRADARDAAFKKARMAADERAAYAVKLAMDGIPPGGPLDMLARDPTLRGADLWERKCATCHTMNGLGGGSAPDLVGWGSAAWVESMEREPDSPLRFGKAPFKGKMPSMTKAPPGKEADFKPMPERDIKQVAAFVSGEGGDAERAEGSKAFGNACNDCHRHDGKGGDDDELAPDLTGWGSYRWLHAQIANPADGTTYKASVMDPGYKGHMPAFADDPEVKGDVDTIARWVWKRIKQREPTPEETAAAATATPARSAAPSASVPAPAPSASASTGLGQ